jgi:hypothetical protein
MSTPCTACAYGVMRPAKKHRFHTAIALLGYACFLLPALGLFSLLSLLFVVVTAPPPMTLSLQRSYLQSAEVPAPLIDRLTTNQPVAKSELRELTPAQQQAVARVVAVNIADNFRHADLASPPVIVAVVIFAAPLIPGFLLTMKTQTLRCTRCRATADSQPHSPAASSAPHPAAPTPATPQRVAPSPTIVIAPTHAANPKIRA